MVQVVTERTTVNSSEALYGHMMNGWEVIAADVKKNRWSLERPNLMKRCKLCGAETTGSVGVAGITWPFLCQKCKDAEDQALDQSVAAVATAVDYVYDTSTQGKDNETYLEE